MKFIKWNPHNHFKFTRYRLKNWQLHIYDFKYDLCIYNSTYFVHSISLELYSDINLEYLNH